MEITVTCLKQQHGNLDTNQVKNVIFVRKAS